MTSSISICFKKRVFTVDAEVFLFCQSMFRQGDMLFVNDVFSTVWAEKNDGFFYFSCFGVCLSGGAFYVSRFPAIPLLHSFSSDDVEFSV